MPLATVFRSIFNRLGNTMVSTWQRAKPTLGRITKYIKRHPFKATAIGVSVLAPGLVSGAILGLLGFSSAGPVAGSVAALVQPSSPPVAGGLFACLQSAAMGGYGVAVVYGLVMASAAVWGWMAL